MWATHDLDTYLYLGLTNEDVWLDGESPTTSINN